jgi:hypothetical protein
LTLSGGPGRLRELLRLGGRIKALSSLAVLGCFAVLAAGSAAQGAGAGPAHRIAGIVPPKNKVAVASAARASCHGPSPCTNLTYHDGPVMHTSTTYAIFWQPPSYTSFDGQPVYDANYKSLIARYFQDLQADSGFLTNVYGPNVQYCDGAVSGAEDCNGVAAGNHITTNTTYGGSWTDTQNFPASGCSDPLSMTTVCLTDAQLIAEIQHAISVNGWSASATNMFFIFTPRGVQSCVDVFCAYDFYCAYHSNVGTGSHALIYANMPYPKFSTDPNLDVCDVGEHPNGDLADAVLNVTSHEHNEAITDPEVDPFASGWVDDFDFTGGENGDKCAWYFGNESGAGGGKYNQTINGHHYDLQLEWSNSDADCVASYGDAPSISNVSPNHGVVGQPIKVKGKHFTGATKVTFNTTDASSFTLKGNTLTAVVAPGSTTGPVHVTTPVGHADGPSFTVDPSPVPTIKTFKPASVPAGATVTVTGTGFWGTSAVKVNGVDVQSFAVKSASRLSFVVGGGNTSGQVSVTTPGGAVVSAGTLSIT